MKYLMVLAAYLMSTPTAAAGGVTPICTRDSGRIICAWSTTQTIELGKWNESPVPACIDCDLDRPIIAEFDCTLVAGDTVTVRCVAVSEDSVH